MTDNKMPVGADGEFLQDVPVPPRASSLPDNDRKIGVQSPEARGKNEERNINLAGIIGFACIGLYIWANQMKPPFHLDNYICFAAIFLGVGAVSAFIIAANRSKN